MAKGNELSRTGRATKWIVACAAIGVLACMPGCASSGSESEAERIVREWRISEVTADRALHVSPPNSGFSVLITPASDGKGTRHVAVLNSDLTLRLAYSPKGILGLPEVAYGGQREGGGRVEWADLDADGQFDVMWRVPGKHLCIFREGRWLKVKGRKNWQVEGYVAEDGNVYKFDGKSGKWLPVPAGKGEKGK